VEARNAEGRDPAISAEPPTLDELLTDHRQAGHARLGADDAARFRSAARLLPPAPATVLDVGCGVGVLTDWLAGRGYAVTGVDTDAVLMERMAAPHRVASIDALPFEDRSFDAVVASEVLEHLPVQVFERSRGEMARVARTAIVVTVPNAESLESASTRCPACTATYAIHGHVRRFDEDVMRDLLPGWRLAQLDEVGPWKARHRSLEWVIRRRLLGRWPAQPGAVCPQCQYRQPGDPSRGEGGGGALSRAVRLLASAPWQQRWWLSARYER
jgi:SAM-dependent methyltransferase